jgi:hypothetical protein
MTGDNDGILSVTTDHVAAPGQCAEPRGRSGPAVPHWTSAWLGRPDHIELPTEAAICELTRQHGDADPSWRGRGPSVFGR